MLILKVLINRNLKWNTRSFEYAYLGNKKILAGTRVLVSFGRSKQSIKEEDDSLGLIDDSIFSDISTEVELTKEKKDVGFIVDVTYTDQSLEEYQENKGYFVKQVHDADLLDKESIISESLYKLAVKMSEYYFTPLVHCLDTILPPFTSLSKSSLNHSTGKFVTYFKLVKFSSIPEYGETFNKTELNLYLKLLNARENKILKSEISAKKALESLIKKGFVSEIKELINYDEIQEIDYSLSTLNQDQFQVLEQIKNSNKKTILLDGVTGSGKSEIYIHLALENYKNNKSTIILVPEISLTEELLRKLKKVFKDDIYPFHSKLSSSSKYQYFKEIVNKEKVVVIGARSAIFAPVNNLKHIIIDEEHSIYAYKNEQMPTYSASKLAQFRCEIENAQLILGSGTPLIESKIRAEKGLYENVVLRNRYSSLNSSSVVQTLYVNMSKPQERIDGVEAISKTTLNALKEVVNKKEQALLLLNRRGYSTIVQCQNCNKIVKCPNCDSYLVYYKNSDEVRCQHCEYRASYSSLKCQKCDKDEFYKIGFGTQKVVEDLSKLLPEARIARLDSDLKKKEEQKQILQDFKDCKYDILIGTDLISKGHNFKNLTLAVALDPDLVFSLPSYNSNELGYDLLSQLVGRLARFDKEGKFIIQSYDVDNPIFDFASKKDYQSFYNFEMNLRRVSFTPPYSYMINIIIKGKNFTDVKKDSLMIKNFLVANLSGKCNIYGPRQPMLSKFNGVYYMNILLKYKSFDAIKSCLNDLTHIELKYNNKLDLDVDPIDV